MKKFLTLFIAVIMALSAISPVSYAEDATAGMHLNYEYDFTDGQLYWKLNSTMVRNGAMEMRNDWCNFALPDGITWKNYVMEFDYHLDEFSAPEKGGWFMAPLKGCNLLMRKGGGVWLYTGAETQVEDAVLREGGDYHFRVEAKDRSLKAYVSGTGFAREKEVLKITNNDGTAGKLSFTGYFKSTVDNIKVYVDPNENFVAKEKVKILKVADTARMEFTKETDADITWESKNPDIASISEDGTILAEKPGFAVIRALDANGNELENMGIYVYEPVVSIGFEDEGKEGRPVYVGDTVGLNVKVQPSNSQTSFEWSLSDEKYGEFYGSSSKRRSFTAKATGEVEITVKDRLSGESHTMKLNIQEKRPSDKQINAEFYTTGRTSKINPEITGFHYGGYNHGDPAKRDERMVAKAKEMNPQSIRNAQEFMWNDKARENWQQYLDENPVWEWANQLNAREFIFCISPATNDGTRWTNDEIMDQIKYVRSHLNPEIKMAVELGNELYAIHFEKYMPTAEDYFKWAAELSDMIHAWDPEVKTIAIGMCAEAETNILSDPTNSEAVQKDNWAYTQGYRIANWNAAMLKYKDHFDGMSAHNYMATEYGEIISQEEFVRMAYAWCESELMLDLSLLRRTDYDLDYYMTEWGVLASNLIWAGGMSTDDKIRYQWMMYPITAIKNMEQALDWLTNGYVVSASNHYMVDSQGFGTIVDATGAVAPNFYTMKKLSELTLANSTYYELYSPNMPYYTMRRPWYNGSDRNVNVDNLKAWGLGDTNGINTVVVANHTNVPQTFSVKGTKLKANWQYGGDVDKLMPDWMRNEKYSSWLFQNDGGVDLSYVPTEITTGDFVEEVVVEPYSVTIFDAEGTPEKLQNTSVGKVSQYAQMVLDSGLALKLGQSKAYKNNMEVQIDPANSAVIPKVKDNRTLLPLRFVSESFGCDVSYDPATMGITVKGDGIDIAMKIGDTAYTVNGKTYRLDVPAEAENGRTLVPLRALAEALGKEVYWDARGVIMIYPPKTGWTSAQDWYDESLKPEIDSVVALFE